MKAEATYIEKVNHVHNLNKKEQQDLKDEWFRGNNGMDYSEFIEWAYNKTKTD